MRNLRIYFDRNNEVTEQCCRAAQHWKSIYREAPLAWWPVLRPGKASGAFVDGWFDEAWDDGGDGERFR